MLEKSVFDQFDAVSAGWALLAGCESNGIAEESNPGAAAVDPPQVEWITGQVASDAIIGIEQQEQKLPSPWMHPMDMRKLKTSLFRKRQFRQKSLLLQ